MRVSRGTRPHGRPPKRTSRPRGGVAPFLRIGAAVISFCLAALGWSWQSITDDPFEVHALDSIYLGSTPTYEEGWTDSGVRYKIIHNEGEQIFSDHYTSYRPGHDRVRIEFDPPVAAVGAECLAGGFRPLAVTSDQALTSQPVLYYAESGYRALVGDAEAISEVTLVTDSGPLILNRIDLRPFPVARPETVACLQDDAILPKAGSVIANDEFAEGAVLTLAPLHAAKFEFHSDGTFVYVPESDYVGLDSFEYRAFNGGGVTLSKPVMATLNVLARNWPPSLESSGDSAPDFVTRLESPERAPILPAVPDVVVDPIEGLNWSTMPQGPSAGEPVRYTLESAPVGATIDAQTGTLRWMPARDAAPGIYEFSVCATEMGPMQLSSVVHFRAEILEENSPIARAHAALRYAMRAVPPKSAGSLGATSGSAAMALRAKAKPLPKKP